MSFALDFARFVVILACISSDLWTDITEITIAQTPGNEEPEYVIATPLSLKKGSLLMVRQGCD